MKHVLLLSQNFPPSTVASVHRCRHLAKYLPEFGWDPTVLVVDESFHKEALDPGLAAVVPESVKIVRARALPARQLGRFGIGDLSLRAYPFIRTEVARLLDKGCYDVVFITGWPFYHMLLAGWIRRGWHVPVVLDFQDPWVSREGAVQNRWSKAGITHRLAVALEPRAVKAASFITSVSEGQNEEMARRYPWLDKSCMAAIPIGGDPADFDALHDYGGKEAIDPKVVTLSYVGTSLPRSAPLFTALFRGLARLLREQPVLADRLRLRFVGTSNQSHGTNKYTVTPIAEREGVGDLIHEEPARVPFFEALSILARSDGVLLIGSDEAHYTASKIYPALMSGRPYLSIFHNSSSAHEILTKAGGGVPLSFTNQAELNNLVPKIAHGLGQIASRRASLGSIDPSAFAPYTARAVTERFARIFDNIVQRDTP